MSVKITNNSSQLKLDNQRQTRLFLRFILDDVDRFSNPITPKKTGELRRGTLKTVTGSSFLRGTIKWVKEYAIYQELKQYRNYTTPGTGPHFALKGVQKAVIRSQDTMRKAGLLK